MYRFMYNLMYPIRFFDDTNGGGGDNSNTGSKTLLTYNYGGEEITVDLSNPDQVKLAQDRLSKGHNMEKIAEERNKLKKQADEAQAKLDAWNNRLDAAKSDPQEFKALVSDLEEYIGRPFTKQEKADLLESDDIDDSDPVMKKLATIEKAFATYKEQQELKEQQRAKAAEEQAIQNEAKQLVAQLDAMEKDTERYPGFDKEAVYNKAVEDGTTNFEMVYYYLNRDAFLKAEREKIEQEYKNLTDKRKAAATESDSSPADLTEPPKVFKKIEDVGRAVKEEIAKGDISFFTED